MFEVTPEAGVNMPIYARKLKKQEIVLKRDNRTNWGRFLGR